MLSKKWFDFANDTDIKVSNRCCYIMKKKPLHKYKAESGKYPIIGTMATEGAQRERAWLLNGCNAFDSKDPKSQPMSFWTEQDVLQYLKEFNIPYCSIYGDIIEDENGNLKTTSCSRTGCVFCAFGAQIEKEPNRFQLLKESHPKLWNYCMKPWDEGGLGMKEVLKQINVKIE